MFLSVKQKLYWLMRNIVRNKFERSKFIVHKMNKNNKSSHDSNSLQEVKSKTKHIEGKSQFTRNKLQRDYQPKLKTFKHKLLKTSQYQKLVVQRMQNQQDEQKVSANALQCFKKGQVIDIDWKTRSNFRKSDIGLKFPRLNTQPLHLIVQNQQNKKTDRSNILDRRRSHSIKNQSIENKCMKLKQLLNLQMSQNRSLFKSSKNSEANQSKNDFNKSIFFQRTNKKSQKSKTQTSYQQKNEIINSPIAGLSVNLSQFLSQQNSNNQNNDDVNFQNLRSQTQNLQTIKAFQEVRIQSERDNKLKSVFGTHQNIEQKSPSSKNTLNIQQKSVQKGTISTQKNQPVKNIQGYDILHDPSIYMLISKSRQKIISYKESLSLKNMSKLQRIKYFEQKRVSQNNSEETRTKSFSAQKQIHRLKLTKEKIVQKIEQKKKSVSQKINKDVSRVFNEIQQYVKNAEIQQSRHCSQIYSYLNLKENEKLDQESKYKLFQSRQGIIKRKKKQSLIEVQQKLLKQVKLSFLKQDLTKKFQQIRSYKENVKNSS